MKRKFTFFIIILALFLGLAGYWYSQKNIYSREILKLEISGPREAGLAEEIEYRVTYKNNGDVRLDEPKLIFEFPSYSILEEGKSLRQEIGTEELGEAIYPGEEKTLRFKARLLGKEGEAKEAKAWLNYRPKNLNAWYESATTFTTVIKEVPLSFAFDLPTKIEPEKEIKFRLNYFSNIDFPLSDLRVKVNYPAGFEFKKATPKPLEEKEWEIGLLNKAEGGRIEISGLLRGEIKEEKIFRAELGTWQEGEFVLLKEVYKGVEIMEPHLYITQLINGSPKYVANPGDTLHYEIFFKNLSKSPLNNLSLVVELEGEAFDFETIKTPDGEHKAGDNSIIFDWKQNPDLQFLDVQEEKKVRFWIDLKDEMEIKDENPMVKNYVFLSQAKEEFETKINSKLEVTQKGYFEDEVFGNSGPIPPEVGRITTYTIIWQAKNYYNQVKNVKVKATLPQGVGLTAKIFPEEESKNFTFDSQSREIVWDLGDLEKGRGVLNPSPNIAFQVGLTPTLDQKGKPAILIKEARISGEDQWTEQILETTSPEIDTTLPDDDTVSEEMGIVQ